jgi:hypothetical protein
MSEELDHTPAIVTSGPPPAEANLNPVFNYRGLTRIARIPACIVSNADLQRLYRDLDAKAKQAMDKHIATIVRAPETTDEDWEKLKEEAWRVGHVTVSVTGTQGEQIVASSIEALDSSGLPHQIRSIVFDSAAGARQSYNVHMANRFVVELDFTEPPGFNAYNPWDDPTPNASKIEVVGDDDTWVTGVYQSILGFFALRKKNRGWLHSSEAFNLLNYVLGFPAALWVVFRLDSTASSLTGVHTALKGAVYVYVFLMVLLIFRGVVWAGRWLFPLIELHGARSVQARATFGVIVTGILTGFLYDVLKTLLN